MLQLGRQTLADPDLPIKAREGKADEVNECMRCFTCFHNSSLTGVFYCATNPVIGHELERKMDNTVRRQEKVLVVGGGVGGMQAALTASECGHQVILCEKTGELGGTCAASATCLQAEAGPLSGHPGPEDQPGQEHRGAAEHRGHPRSWPVRSPPTPSLPPPAPGPPFLPCPASTARTSMGAEDVYHDPEKTGAKVVIMGGGLVGVELGIWLAQSGKDVTVVEMAPQAAGRPATRSPRTRSGWPPPPGE